MPRKKIPAKPSPTWYEAMNVAKATKAAEAKEKKIKQIPLPANMAAMKLTGSMLSKGTYQKRILAFYAQYNLPSLMSGLDHLCQEGNVQAMKLTAEIYKLVSSGKGDLNVLVNQNTNNVADHSTHKTSTGPTSFEDIQCILEEERKNRMAITATAICAPSFEATPDSDVEYEAVGQP